jgi:hypothetical protein
LELFRGAAGHAFARVSAPPSARPSGADLYSSGSVAALVFANPADGYAIDRAAPGSDGGLLGATTGPVYATTDGGRSWRAATWFGPGVRLFGMVASGGEFYAVLAHCPPHPKTTLVCRDLTLARSRARSGSWSSEAIPGFASLAVDFIGLAAQGGRVWLTYQRQVPSAQPVLIESVGGVPPFTVSAAPALESVAACTLTATSARSIWAHCPTGLLASWLRSTDGGRHFSRIWTTGGTSGAAFAAVSATTAYRFLGPPSRELQRTTDGGRRFVSRARLPASAREGVIALLFTSARDGFALAYATTGPPTLLQTFDGGLEWTMVPWTAR